MENKRLSFATVSASPTAASWSQAYTAGTLFVVLSLKSTEAESEEAKDSLSTIGKEILNTLEAEYFSIETKNLALIKKAFELATKQVVEKEDIILSAGLLSVIDDVLYIILIGGAKAIMKRGGAFGTLLTSEEKQTVSASGFLENNDIVVLETEQFGKIIPKSHLKNTIDHNSPLEVAENLSPLLHQQEEGGAAAVIFSYKEPVEIIEKEEETPKESSLKHFFSLFMQKVQGTLQSYKHVIRLNLTRKQKLFLSVAILLTLLLFGSGLFVLKQKDAGKNQALFQEIFDKAKTKYDEGQSLLSLNKNLARDDFAEAKKIITENKEKLPKNSKYQKELDALLQEVEISLDAASSVNMVEAKAVSDENSLLLTTFLKNSPLFVTQDEKSIYGIDRNSVFTVDKKSKNKKVIIENKNYWSDVGGLGVYFGNVYVLDKKEGQIFKFSGESFTKTNYLVSGAQDLLKSTSLTIDGSVWVLFENGEIKKFTRGKIDDLKISGLDKPFTKPSRIFTDGDTNNVYILDNGNSRIVVLGKSGIYQTQYQTTTLKDAREFEVLEKDKKVFILSGGKIWQIDLQ